MKDLILHSLKMRKVGSLAVIVSIALSTCLCLALGLTYGGVMKGVELSEARSGSDLMVVPLQARTSVSDTTLLFTGAPAPIYMESELYEQIASLEGAEKASPQFFSQTLDAGCCSVGGETRLIGIDFETDFVVTPLLDHEIDGLGDYEIICGGNVPGSKVGMEMMILGETYTIAEVLPDTGGELDDCIVIDIDRARELAYKIPEFDEIFSDVGKPEDLISTVVIAADEDGSEYSSLRVAIRQIPGIALIENSEAIDSAQKQLKSVFVLLGVTTVAMIAVTLLQLFARFYTCVWDRKSELALYRAVGADISSLRKMICGEIGVMVALGCLAGLITGFIGQSLLQKILVESLDFPFVAFGIGECVGLSFLIVLVFAAIAFLAVFWPLKQISRIDPSLAMQQGDID